jgi:hypothetical protein
LIARRGVAQLDLEPSGLDSTGVTDGAVYQAWMKEQTSGVLRAVTGDAWGDAAHPWKARPARVYIGLPAMPPSAHHDPEAESIEWATPGVDRALTELIGAGALAAQRFAGVAVYLHHDGTGSDGYASWTSDWAALARRWSGR